MLPRLACASVRGADRLLGGPPQLRRERAQRVALRTSFGAAVAALGEQTIAAGASATFTGHLRLANPILWSPASPHLYTVTLDAAPAPSGRAT